MERTNKKVPETEVKDTRLSYRKIGGGCLYWNHNGIQKIIKPNEVFKAHPEDLPKQFMDTLVCLEPDELEKQKKNNFQEAHTPEKLYKIKKAKDTDGLYNIVQIDNGKILNDKPVSREDAEKILTALS